MSLSAINSMRCHISNRITVLRDGHDVETVQPKRGNITKGDLARLMVGREVLLNVPKLPKKPGEARLLVKDLWVRDDRELPAVKGVNFEIRAGEILGFAGAPATGKKSWRKHCAVCGRSKKGDLWTARR